MASKIDQDLAGLAALRTQHKAEEKVLAVKDDLLRAVRQAGGDIALDRLMGMNMNEFIRVIAAPNGITFKVRMTKTVDG